MYYLLLLLPLLLLPPSRPARALRQADANSRQASARQTLSPLGVWTNAEKKATFEIYKCGERLCGKIVSLTEPNDPQTKKPKTDANNPDPQLRTRPLLGLVFMQNFKYDDQNKWEDGKIYDPQTGKTYSAYFRLESANQMEVKGYIGFSLIGKSQTWTRVK